MKRTGIFLACSLLFACSVVGCASSDGGQSGTGISAIRGNVVAVIGAEPDVAGIRVSLAATTLTTLTDVTGRFELSGKVSGPDELRFERDRDALFARTDVVIPAGGILDLEGIVVDADTNEARPARQQVQFEGIVDLLNCAGGAIRLIPKDDDPQATAFTVDVATATIRDDGVLLACDDLQLGDRLQVRGETMDGVLLINAELELEASEDGPNQQRVEFEGIVDALGCASGTIRLVPKDDDPQATAFTVDVASATIRDDGVLLACDDLHVGDRLQVRGETTDGVRLINTELELERSEDG